MIASSFSFLVKKAAGNLIKTMMLGSPILVKLFFPLLHGLLHISRTIVVYEQIAWKTRDLYLGLNFFSEKEPCWEGFTIWEEVPLKVRIWCMKRMERLKWFSFSVLTIFYFSIFTGWKWLRTRRGNNYTSIDWTLSSFWIWWYTIWWSKEIA